MRVKNRAALTDRMADVIEAAWGTAYSRSPGAQADAGGGAAGHHPRDEQAGSVPQPAVARADTSYSLLICGLRTLDHLHPQLAAVDTVLSAGVLDAIDAIVALGIDLAAHEKNDTPPALLGPSLRRR